MGDQRRIAAALRTVSDFGIATECGRGRGDPTRAPASSTATASRPRANDPCTCRVTHAKQSPGTPGRFSPDGAGVAGHRSGRRVCAVPYRSRSTSWSALRADPFAWPISRRTGVRRISLATSLYRAAMSGVAAAATEAMEKGTFSYVDQVMSSAEVASHMRR